MVGLDDTRKIAMALEGVDEGPPVPAARRVASFKVAGRSFLGVETGGKSATVCLPEDVAKVFVAMEPKAYEEIWRNGTAFMGLRVDLTRVPKERVRKLIESSWQYCVGPRRVATKK